MLTRIEMFFMDWILDHHRVLGITNTETLAFKSKTYITADYKKRVVSYECIVCSVRTCALVVRCVE